MLKWMQRPARLVPIAFLAIILVGTGLLLLPLARADGAATPFLTAFFVATSAVAVTGLSVVDTASYWSVWGQAIIFALFQVGAVGIMSSASLLVVLVSRRLSLSRQMIITAESRGIVAGDVTTVLKLAVSVMVATELATAVLMYSSIASLGYTGWAAVGHAVFHAGAAFTNAGFSTLPGGASLFVKQPVFLIAAMMAVFVGGLGLPVLHDLNLWFRQRRRLSLHSKLTLVTTIALFAASFVLTAAFEWANPATLALLSAPDRLVNAAYHGFMSRSCGMNALDMGQMTEETMLITQALMLIGGGSASTAGGLKVSTFAILLLAVWHEIRGNTDLTAFGRRISSVVQREALAVLVVAFGIVALGIMALRLLCDLPLRDIVFEVISAFANVGLSMNATPMLPPSAQIVVILLMFVGRIGTITVAAALALRDRRADFRYPEERPIVG